MREQIEQLMQVFEGKREEFAKYRDTATDPSHARISDAKAATYGYVLIQLATLLDASQPVSGEIDTRGRV